MHLYQFHIDKQFFINELLPFYTLSLANHQLFSIEFVFRQFIYQISSAIFFMNIFSCFFSSSINQFSSDFSKHQFLYILWIYVNPRKKNTSFFKCKSVLIFKIAWQIIEMLQQTQWYASRACEVFLFLLSDEITKSAPCSFIPSSAQPRVIITEKKRANCTENFFDLFFRFRFSFKCSELEFLKMCTKK